MFRKFADFPGMRYPTGFPGFPASRRLPEFIFRIPAKATGHNPKKVLGPRTVSDFKTIIDFRDGLWNLVPMTWSLSFRSFRFFRSFRSFRSF